MVWSDPFGRGGRSAFNQTTTGLPGRPSALSQAEANALRELDAAQVGLIQDIETQLTLGLYEGLTRAVERGSKSLSDDMRGVQRMLSEMPAGVRTTIHREVGIKAQRTLVQAFTHRRNRRNTPAYRINPKNARNKRYAGGALLRALQAPDMWQATPNGLRFLNTQRLDQEARHWRRINFGAGAAHGSPPARYNVEWDGMVVTAMGLQPDPRPAFRMPRGLWLGEGGARIKPGQRGREFYPRGEAPTGAGQGRLMRGRMTRGIAASNFVDASVRRIARELPNTYIHYYRLYVDRVAKSQGRGGQVNVSAQIKKPKVVLRRINR